jgi:hypothetical protein
MKTSPRALASVKRTSPSSRRTTRAIKPIDEETVYTCILCKKSFANAEGFKAHHVHVFTSAERCLDADELRALDFATRKNGVWETKVFTQLLPSQIARLATVRQEQEALAKRGVGAGLPTLQTVQIAPLRINQLQA